MLNKKKWLKIEFLLIANQRSYNGGVDGRVYDILEY